MSSRRDGRARPSRLARGASALLAALVAVGVAGCGAGSTDHPGGADISSGTVRLNVVAYAVPKPAFDELIPAFRATPAGHDVGFSASYGASGDQSRKVARHVPTDVVNFSVAPDVTRLVKAGLVDPGWEKARPHLSTPFGSVVTLVVRKGNPKGIHDWNDLLKPGVEVITPNPGSSGSAKWNLLAPFAALGGGGADRQAGLDFVRSLVRDHITVNPKSGREATTTFEQGQGDVLISYENEAIMLARKGGDVDIVTPPQTFRIDNPVALVSTSENKDAANAFLDFLFTPEAQRIWARQGFRPTDPAALKEAIDGGLFAPVAGRLWTIDDVGAALDVAKDGKRLQGWAAVDQALFGASGAITKIYDSRGK